MSGPDSDLDKLLGPDKRILQKRDPLSVAVLVVGLLIVVGLVLLWPREQPDIDLTTFGFAENIVSANVTSSVSGPCSYAEDLECFLVSFEVTDSDSEGFGSVVDLEFAADPGQPTFQEGDRVFLYEIESEDGVTTYQLADRDRRLLLGILGAVFAAAVILLGRLRGLAALAGLVISIAILFLFILPAIISGTDAVLIALVGGGAIAMVSLYLAHGYTPLTHVAAIGAFSALALTVALSWLVVTLAQFSGLVTEEAFYLLAIPDLDLNGLLLAGIVLGAIGALDDVTVTQASAVWEVRKANPSLGSEALYESGLRVGRDHIVSTVNTLLLAYAGASLPLLILFNLADQPLGVIASSEVVALEIVRTIVGSMGLVAAVPVTTWLGSRVVRRIDPSALGR